MDHVDHCDALALEIERFAALLEVTNGNAEVVTCPGWRVIDVAEHVGRVHRWAYELVSRRSQVRIRPAHLDLDERDVTPMWIRDGGTRLVQLLRTTDPDVPMWAWGADQHVRFWSRRQLHETLVHRMDVEIAAGREPSAATQVAVDAIDEFLVNLQSAAVFSPRVRELRGDERRLRVRETQTATNWTLTLHEDGFDVSTKVTDVDVDATVIGPALELLLTLYRRRPLDGSTVRVQGDASLVAFWLERTALE